MEANDKNSPLQVLSNYFVRERHTDFQARAEGEDLLIEGYFVVFDQPYHVRDGLDEIIKRSAFDEQTDRSDVKALTNHDSTLVLGRDNEHVHTLTYRFDDVGLWASIRINARDFDAISTHARVQRGDVDQASFGFDADDIAYVPLADGRIQREIRHISKLYEVSVCTFPAYEQTSLNARDRFRSDVETLEREKQSANTLWKNQLKERLNKCH